MITGIGGMTEIDDKLFKITVVDADTVTLDDVDGTGFSAFTSGGTLTQGAFYIAKESVAMKDFTGGNSLATDHFGATGVAAMMQAFEPSFRTDYPENGFARDFGDGANQVLGEAVDGDEWLRASSGMAAGTYSASGTTLFGNDYAYQYVGNELCVLGGGSWGDSSRAGVFARIWSYYRADSLADVGFRAASYIN